MNKTLKTVIGVGAAAFIIAATPVAKAKASAREMPIQPLMGDTIRTPCSTPAKTSIAYAQAMANMEASRKRAYAALGEEAPVETEALVPAAKMKVAEPAIPASALNDLYNQVNKYADLTPEQRDELGANVAKTKDADLIDTYNAMKTQYGNAPAAPEVKRPQAPETVQGTPAKEKVEEEPGKAPETEGGRAPNAIDELYQQVNKYADLTPAEQEELGKKVAETKDADLIETCNAMKAQYGSKPAPVEIKTVPAKPAEADSSATEEAPLPKLPADSGSVAPQVQPAAADSSGYEVTLPSRIEEKIEAKTPVEKQEERREGIENTMAKVYQEGTTNPEVIMAVVQPDLKPVRDSLENVVRECYASINAMAPETFAADSARIASAIAGIEAVTAKSFPKGDSWVEYTLGNLKEYFAEMGQVIGGKKE